MPQQQPGASAVLQGHRWQPPGRGGGSEIAPTAVDTLGNTHLASGNPIADVCDKFEVAEMWWDLSATGFVSGYACDEAMEKLETLSSISLI